MQSARRINILEGTKFRHNLSNNDAEVQKKSTVARP